MAAEQVLQAIDAAATTTTTAAANPFV